MGKKFKKKVSYSESDDMLVKLDTVAKAKKSGSRVAISLCIHWLKYQSWTPKQWALARKICGELK